MLFKIISIIRLCFWVKLSLQRLYIIPGLKVKMTHVFCIMGPSSGIHFLFISLFHDICIIRTILSDSAMMVYTLAVIIVNPIYVWQYLRTVVCRPPCLFHLLNVTFLVHMLDKTLFNALTLLHWCCFLFKPFTWQNGYRRNVVHFRIRGKKFPESSKLHGWKQHSGTEGPINRV